MDTPVLSPIPEDGPLDPGDYGICALPRHVAVIMDGNGRWARRQNRPRLFGHRAGAESVRRTLRTAYRLGVEYLTLYAFSEQNWQRPPEEVQGLMGLLVHHIRKEQAELLDRGIRFRAAGDIDKLPPEIIAEIRHLEDLSEDFDELQLTVALSYGGREEITDAVVRIAREVADGRLSPDDIDMNAIASRLWTSALPDPDLLVRTSGELRISNFLLWQIAYTELYVTDEFWPEFDERSFIRACQAYSRRQRRFGRTGDQIDEAV